MIWVRGLIYGFPLVIAVLFAASFRTARVGPPGRLNQLTTGSIGEAKILNPIQSTTSADSEVSDFIFNGLLKYDENIEITGDLAKSWELRQRSTIFCNNPGAAADSLARVEALKQRWPEWHLASASAEAGELRLELTMPGRAASREIHKELDPALVQPVTVLQVAIKSSARESLRHFLDQAVTAPQIKRAWVDTSTSFDLTVAGDPQPVLDELGKYYSANPDLEARFLVVEQLDLLDEPRIRFILRDDVRWHDGEPFTADDVEFTYKMIMDETVASPRRPDYELVDNVQVPGPHELVVTYRKPFSPALTSWMMGILPKHVLAGKSSQWWAENFNRSPIGTGPFKFAEWRSNEFIRLVRNDDYFPGRPHLESVAIRTIPDPVSIRLAFETRQIDFWGVDQHAVANFEKDARFEIFAAPRPAYEYVGWNLRNPLFQDVRVRRALAHAVDVDAIIKYVLYGHGERSTGIFPPQMWFFNPGVKPLDHDPEMARVLLAEAGWKPGPDGILQKDGQPFKFDLITNQGNEVRKDIATLVQADLKKLGIQVDIGIYEWAVFISQYVNKLDFDAVVLGWSLGYDFDHYQIWHSSQTGPGMLNFVGYQDKQVDAMLEEIRTEYDHEQIKQMAARLQSKIYDDQPYLFLFVPKGVAAMWRDSYRVLRPADGGWLDEPVRLTKAGFGHYMQWFYHPEFRPQLAP